MSEASEYLTDRIRMMLGDDPAIREQRMFGGTAFMLHGNMLVGPMKDGGLLVRVGKQGYQAALELPGAAPMTMTGRTMSGFIQVSGDVLEEDSELGAWIERARDFVLTLPPK